MYLRIYEGTYGQRYFEMIEHLEYMILTLYSLLIFMYVPTNFYGMKSSLTKKS